MIVDETITIDDMKTAKKHMDTLIMFSISAHHHIHILGMLIQTHPQFHHVNTVSSHSEKQDAFHMPTRDRNGYTFPLLS